MIDQMKSKYILAPSILAADFTRLGEEIKEAQAGGADWIHIDVMDGHFVPNITMGPLVVDACQRVTNLPLDVHLMIEKPEKRLEDFAKAGASRLTVHVETCLHLHQTIKTIKDLGLSAGVALNPGTPLSLISEIMEDVDLVLIMTVNPGFGGQKLIKSTLMKVKEARERERSDESHPFYIQVDGGINSFTIGDVASAGADVFVAGTAIFKHPHGVIPGIQALQKALEPVKVKE
jgi:ribulose-phosphate 3-epimerase